MNDALNSNGISRHRRRRFIAAWIILWCVAGTSTFLLLLRILNRNAPTTTTPSRWHEILATIRDGDPHPIRNPAQYVWDSACLLRPRADVSVDLRIGPVGGGEEIPYTVRHVQWGLIRPEPLPDPLTQPAVLLVGDSHMYGFCDVRHNAATLLEETLRASSHPRAIVANGSCPYYSLYQIAERMRTLSPRIMPNVSIAVVFVGNDLIELEDTGRPHLADDLTQQPIDPDTPPEATSARRMIYNRCRPRLYGELFWQGMNQAIYLHQYPQRYDAMLAKAVRCVELMHANARAHDAELIVVLLPSYDDHVDFHLPFADDPTMGPIVAEQSNRRLRLDLAAAITRLKIPLIDAAPLFRASDLPDLYSGDFHIWKNAHRLVATALAPMVQDSLPRRRP
jgi:hypothetical protein